MFDRIFGTSSTETLTTGLSVPPNTFAHSVLETLEDGVFDELAVDLPVREHGDKNLGGDPFMAAQMAQASRANWTEEEGDSYVGLSSMIHTSTLGGTGYLAHRFAGVPDMADSSMDVLEVLVGSDEAAVEQRPKATIAQALAYPFIDTGTILLSNQVRQSSKPRVAADVAGLIATVARHDIADLKHYVYTGHYKCIKVADNQRTKADFARILSNTVRGETWFDPRDWMWWAADADMPPALADNSQAIAVVPEGYEDVSLTGEGTVHAISADVDDIHVVVLHALRREWVEELRVGGLRWLHNAIVDDCNEFADLWMSYTREHGLDDPVATFEDLLASNYGGDIAEEAVEKALAGPQPPQQAHADRTSVAGQSGVTAGRTDGGFSRRDVAAPTRGNVGHPPQQVDSPPQDPHDLAGQSSDHGVTVGQQPTESKQDPDTQEH